MLIHFTCTLLKWVGRVDILSLRPSNWKFWFSFQARTDMEQQTIEGASTSDAVGFITVVQSLKRKLKNWEKNVEV